MIEILLVILAFLSYKLNLSFYFLQLSLYQRIFNLILLNFYTILQINKYKFKSIDELNNNIH